ncbi:alpha/beta fold hydrolase [Alkaliphilus sp. B6464]|uniref:alpha/beta fold hydrolase n=1 Tax=Alkaliphilus sp. B6464 TaxID=2731219 RepID=UPI001BAB218B|nr:alpha/beta hydrolase [Alkaliphilus sp. B6464]QUH20924.1 alpha/beta hydrolase [Alkaliphilus sp. B6464]
MECKIKNISINYEVIGDGKPIIMLHGYSPDHRLMTGCMEPIFSVKDNYKRIYIDLPGMGKSESAEWITNSDVMLEIVIDFIERIIPNENFLLAGESYGGYLSRGIIYKMADKVDGVLLICPVIIANNKKRNVPEHVVLVKDNILLSELIPEDAENFNSMAVVQNNIIYERYKNEIISGVKIADIRFLESLKENGYEFSFDVDNINKKFDKPTLILLGKQDSSVGYKDAWNILDNFPRATFSVLDKAGHNLQIEQEELFNSLVNEWLIRVDKKL